MSPISQIPETREAAPVANRDWRGRNVIIGGGIIGLSIGWQLVRRGHEVTIVEKGEAGRGASWVAAGMLAPYAEIGFEEVEFFRICRESLEVYPRFLEELAKDLRDASDTSAVPRLDDCGTLLVAMSADDEAYLNRFHKFQLRIGLRSTTLSSAEARDREPLLSPRVKSALLLEDDKQINNRTLIAALREAFIENGGELIERTSIDNADALNAEAVIIAAGAYSSNVSESLRQTNPVRPVKGQIVTLRVSQGFALRHAIRSPRGYLLQKDDGRILVGATSEEMGFDTTITAGAVMDLLRKTYEIVPMTYELEISEINTGLRPATRNHLPEIGYSGHGNVYHAIGHYRHGILLAPYTAYRIAEMITERVANRSYRTDMSDQLV